MINSISKLLLFMLAYLLVIEAVIFTYLYQYSTLFYTILVLVISTALIIGLNKLLIHTLETQKGNPKSESEDIFHSNMLQPCKGKIS